MLISSFKKAQILIKAKKRFGQNFLKDESIKRKIIQAMPNDAKDIVEIGPGLGDLTQKLLDSQKRVSAFEIDLELCDLLQKKFEKELLLGELTLVCDDVLDVWRDDSLLDQEYHMIANLPYYIATKIILKALADNSCETILVMVQKELALKFAAHCGNKEFSSLAILANSIADVEVLFDVPKESFEPQPKVTSAILRINKLQEFIKSPEKKGLFETHEEFEKFKHFLRVAFKAPRKMVYKNLQELFDKLVIIKLFDELNILHSVRPHQLPIETYHLLFKKLK